jgi:superfamily II DNA or RNA helicase
VGNALFVCPWHPGLGAELTASRAERENQGYRVRRRTTKEELYVLGEGQGITFGGFFARVERFCQKHGVEYQVINEQELLPMPDFSRVEQLRARQDEFIASITASYRGIIKVPTAAGKSFAIRQVCRMYPKQRILVTTRRASKVKELYEELAADDTGIKVSLCDGSHRFVAESRVVVCTSSSLKKIPVKWPHLLLFDEVHGAGAKGVQRDLAGFASVSQQPKFFGFSASPKGRSDGAHKQIEAFFGQVIMDMSYQEAEDHGLVVPIDVYMYRVSGSSISAQTDVAKARRGIWRNRKRNTKIAEVVQSIDPAHKVLIIVKTLDHALHLHRLLPDFSLAYAGMSPDQRSKFVRKGLIPPDYAPVDVMQLAQDFKDGKVTRVIATHVWSEGVDFPDLQYLVRADGETGDIACTQIPGRLSRIAEGKTRGVLIDFWDDFGQYFVNRSDKRINQYQKRGWTCTIV